MQFKTFLFILLAAPLITSAQKDTAVVVARYAFTHIMDTTMPDKPLTENMALLIGSRKSEYVNWDRLQRSRAADASAKASGTVSSPLPTDVSSIKSVSVDGGVITVTNANGSVTVTNLSGAFSASNAFFKDMEAGKLFFTPYAGGKLYAVEEKIPAIDWTITQETKQVQGMNCQKATCRFRGRDYEAWFCSQIPYSNGPWKLGGLPGLILEASDAKKEVVFSFVSFENVSGPQTVVDLPEGALRTTPKEYKQYADAIARDRRAGTASSGDGAGGATVRIAAAPSGAPAKQRKMNNPIEKENL